MKPLAVPCRVGEQPSGRSAPSFRGDPGTTDNIANGAFGRTTVARERSVRAPENLQEKQEDVQDIEKDARGERDRLVGTGMTQAVEVGDGIDPRTRPSRRATRSCRRPRCARRSAQSQPGAVPAVQKTRTDRGTTGRGAPHTRLTRGLRRTAPSPRTPDGRRWDRRRSSSRPSSRRSRRSTGQTQTAIPTRVRYCPALANWRPNRQASATSQEMNHVAPPEFRPSQTPNVANPTVTATRPITRPNSAGVDASGRAA